MTLISAPSRLPAQNSENQGKLWSSKKRKKIIENDNYNYLIITLTSIYMVTLSHVGVSGAGRLSGRVTDGSDAPPKYNLCEPVVSSLIV